MRLLSGDQRGSRTRAPSKLVSFFEKTHRGRRSRSPYCRAVTAEGDAFAIGGERGVHVLRGGADDQLLGGAIGCDAPYIDVAKTVDPGDLCGAARRGWRQRLHGSGGNELRLTAVEPDAPELGAAFALGAELACCRRRANRSHRRWNAPGKVFGPAGIDRAVGPGSDHQVGKFGAVLTEEGESLSIGGEIGKEIAGLRTADRGGLAAGEIDSHKRRGRGGIAAGGCQKVAGVRVPGKISSSVLIARQSGRAFARGRHWRERS